MGVFNISKFKEQKSDERFLYTIVAIVPKADADGLASGKSSSVVVRGCWASIEHKEVARVDIPLLSQKGAELSAKETIHPEVHAEIKRSAEASIRAYAITSSDRKLKAMSSSKQGIIPVLIVATSEDGSIKNMESSTLDLVIRSDKKMRITDTSSRKTYDFEVLGSDHVTIGGSPASSFNIAYMLHDDVHKKIPSLLYRPSGEGIAVFKILTFNVNMTGIYNEKKSLPRMKRIVRELRENYLR